MHRSHAHASATCSVEHTSTAATSQGNAAALDTPPSNATMTNVDDNGTPLDDNTVAPGSVRFRWLGGHHDVVVLPDFDAATVGELRAAILRRTAFDAVRLVFNGRVLANDEAFLAEDYGLRPGATVDAARDHSAPSSATTASPSDGLASSPARGSSGPFAPQNMSGSAASRGSASSMRQPDPFGFNRAAEVFRDPIARAIFSRPELLKAIMQRDPRFAALSKSNPEVMQVLNDPGYLSRTLQMMENPELMKEMMRTQDRALSSIESIPGSMNVLTSAYKKTVAARTESNPSTDEANRIVAERYGVKPRENIREINTEPLPNPWAPPPPRTPSREQQEANRAALHSLFMPSLNPGSSSPFSSPHSGTGLRFPPPFMFPRYTNPNGASAPSSSSLTSNSTPQTPRGNQDEQRPAWVENPLNTLFGGAFGADMPSSPGSPFQQPSSASHNASSRGSTANSLPDLLSSLNFLGATAPTNGPSASTTTPSSPHNQNRQHASSSSMSTVGNGASSAASSTTTTNNPWMASLMQSAQNQGFMDPFGLMPNSNALSSFPSVFLPQNVSLTDSTTNTVSSTPAMEGVSRVDTTSAEHSRGGPVSQEDMDSATERFTEQLATMNEMGFVEKHKNIRALMASGGNVESAIDYILNNLS